MDVFWSTLLSRLYQNGSSFKIGIIFIKERAYALSLVAP